MQTSKNLLKYILLVLGFYLLFCILCIEVEKIANQDIKEKLALKMGNPFGPITYMIIHVDSTHLISNVIFIIIFAFLLCLLLWKNPSIIKVRTVIYFIFIPIISAIIAAIIHLYTCPKIVGGGASGVAFAMLGCIAYISTLSLYEQFKKKNPISKISLSLTLFSISIFILSMIIKYDPKISVIGHSLSFAISFLLNWFLNKIFL